MGSEAKFEMQWDKVLDGQFFRLEFKNETTGENEKMAMKATGYYKLIDESAFVGTWFDSRGITFPLKGKVLDNQLIVEWGTPETEVGRSVYTIQSNGQVLVEDYIKQQGKDVLFAKALYN